MIEITPATQGLCCSFFSWEKRKPANSDIHYIVLKNSDVVYGSGDSKSDLRTKFATLAIWEVFFGVIIRMPARFLSLVSGDFVRAGLYLGRKEWNEEKRIRAFDPNSVPLGKGALYRKVCKHTLYQLTKNIAQLVTYPLAIIAMAFSALYGILNPLDGRHLYAKIEHAWSRDIIPDNRFLCIFTDYLAQCMQPREIHSRITYAAKMEEEDSFIKSMAYIEKQLKLHESYFFREHIEVRELTTLLETVKSTRRGKYTEVELQSIKNALKVIKHARKILLDLPKVQGEQPISPAVEDNGIPVPDENNLTTQDQAKDTIEKNLKIIFTTQIKMSLKLRGNPPKAEGEEPSSPAVEDSGSPAPDENNAITQMQQIDSTEQNPEDSSTDQIDSSLKLKPE